MKKSKKNNWDKAVKIMERLRGPGGCPWDKEQTHHSLTPYLIEEAYEVLEAIEENQPDRLCEELGDLLLQIIFHSQIAKEDGAFDINEVIENLVSKLERRHPHVFKGEKINTTDEVLKKWEQIKLEEKGSFQRHSLMDGIPCSLPSLLAAERVQMRAAEAGFDWPDVGGVLEKIKEEAVELAQVYNLSEERKLRGNLSKSKKNASRIKEEFGDLLFALVNFSRFIGINADEALRVTIKKFVNRFKYMEKASGGREAFSEMDLEEMNKYWEGSKKIRRRKKELKKSMKEGQIYDRD